MTTLLMIYLIGMIAVGLLFGLTPYKGASLRIIIGCMVFWPSLMFSIIRDSRKRIK